MSSQEHNKRQARALFEHASRGELDAFGEHLAPDFVLHPDDWRGADGLAEMVRGYRSVLPDLTVRIDHQFAEGDYVATRFTVRGTHQGALMSEEPTGRTVEFSGITISRCADGRILEEWEYVDAIGLLGQLGVLTPAAGTPA